MYEELRRVAQQAERLSHELARFPLLQERLMGCVQRMLKRQLEPCTTIITNLVRIELAYINTNHPRFLGGSNAVASLVNQKSGGPSAPSPKQVSPKKKDSRKKELPRHGEGSGPNPGAELENGGLFGMFWGPKAGAPQHRHTCPWPAPWRRVTFWRKEGAGAIRRRSRRGTMGRYPQVCGSQTSTGEPFPSPPTTPPNER
jgi:dynamin 1-like protein